MNPDPRIVTYRHDGRWWGYVAWPQGDHSTKLGPFEDEEAAVFDISDANGLERPAMDVSSS